MPCIGTSARSRRPGTQEDAKFKLMEVRQLDQVAWRKYP